MLGTVYEKLRKSCPLIHISLVQVRCITTTAQSFSVDATVTCNVRIDRCTWKFRFYVVEDLMHPVILGSDILAKTRLLVEIQEGLAFFIFDRCIT
jgi:hypothetical protein